MDAFTKIIESTIHKKYKSVRAFSKEIGIPQTTISSALKTGFGSTNFDTVMKICAFLDISINNIPANCFSEEDRKILAMYTALDKTGTEKINEVINKIKS